MRRGIRRVVIVVPVLAAVAVLMVTPLPFRLSTTVDSAVSIARPPAVVYAYVTTAGHWPEWHPSSLGVIGAVDHPLALGEQVTEEFRVAGRRGRAQWTVIAREPARVWAIEGRVRGRPAGVVTYELEPAAEGTRFRALVGPESAEAVRRLKRAVESAP